jgi:methyl-accepting chemotaxis protein
LAKLEEQQAQIREYTVVLERQKTDWQERSQSLEAIQKQLLALAELLATQGGNAFQETFEGIDQIANQASQIVEDSGRLREETLQIQTINQVIGEIAARINLLAFNTTVESERAGPQAKGLSLLALEVRRLSGEATQATRKIQNITTAIAEYSERNVSSARGGAQVASDLKYKSQAAGRTLADLRSLLQELTESSKRLAEVEF